MPPTDTPPAEFRAAAALREVFGREPRWHASAPGRVNLIGEHIDYNGGHVLPIAIDRRFHAVAAAGGEAGMIRVVAADVGERWTVSAASDLRRAVGGFGKGSWQRYVGGVLALFSESAGESVPAIDIALASDVPFGSGLSSSAALCVSLAALLEAVTEKPFDPLEKARLCQRVEHEFAGVPCGLMDPAVSSLAKAGHALLLDCSRTVPLTRPRVSAFVGTSTATDLKTGPWHGQLRHIPFPPPTEAVLLVVNTKVRHSLADGEYAKRRAACESAARKLGVSELCRAKIESLAGAGLTDEEHRCATHAINEEHRTLAAAEALERGDLAHFGRLMNESHASLRDLYGVSCSELDTVAAAAQRSPGVFGGRMTGGGFGGCAIALVKPEAIDAVQQTLTCAFAGAFGRECDVSVVRPSSGARVHGKNV